MYKPHIFEIRKAIALPVLALDVLSDEKTEAFMIQVLNKLGICVNVRSEGEGLYGQSGFYLAPVQHCIMNMKEYEVAISDTNAIQCAERNNCFGASANIRGFFGDGKPSVHHDYDLLMKSMSSIWLFPARHFSLLM